MSTVAYQTVQTATTGSGTTLVLTKPASLAVGDRMIVHLIGVSTPGAGNTWAILSGWSAITSNLEVGNGITAFFNRFLTKIADSADVAATNFTFTYSATKSLMGSICRISDPTPNTYGVENADLSGAGTGVTPDRANALLLYFGIAIGTSATAFSSYAVANNNPSWTEDYDFNTGGSSQFGMAGAHASYSAASITGSASATVTGGTVSLNYYFLLAVHGTIDVTVSPSLITSSGVLNAPTITGGGSVAVGATITAAGTVKTPISMGQAPWSTVAKSSASTWNNTSKT